MLRVSVSLLCVVLVVCTPLSDDQPPPPGEDESFEEPPPPEGPAGTPPLGDVLHPNIPGDARPPGLSDTDVIPPVPDMNDLDCYQAMEEGMEHWYSSCNVSMVAPLCYDIDCPDNYNECESDKGVRYKPDGGKEWNESRDGKKYVCSCVHPGAVYWSVPAVPVGAPEFSPIKSCDLDGCVNSYTGEFILPGTEYLDTYNNATCRCVPGQDPNLMDASSRFYVDCNDHNLASST